MFVKAHTAVELFQEFKLDYEAALNPCMICLFEKCPEEEQGKLDALLEAYDLFPSPPYSPVQLRRIEQKMAPIVERAMADPAVIASEDQRAATWRDTPWWRKAYRRARFRAFVWKLRLRGLGRRKPWE
jgi:hypothetical protein